MYATKFNIAILLTIISIIATSCDSGANVANILPPDIQYSADTMFSSRQRKIQKDLDSICLIHMDSLVSIKIDSIMRIEQEIIKSITRDQ